jgi:hypothetical protein
MPNSVIKLKPEKNQITIIPNRTQNVKTNLLTNGVVIKRYGEAYGKMTFPDGRYYEGGFEKDRDFGGVGMYLHSNGDHYHGQWKNSTKDGLGKWFVKSLGKYVYGIFKLQPIGVNPKDPDNLKIDPPFRMEKEMQEVEFRKIAMDRKINHFFS